MMVKGTWLKREPSSGTRAERQLGGAIKAYVVEVLAKKDPVELTRYNPEKTFDRFCKEAFKDEIDSDKKFYGSIDVDDMVDEVKLAANGKHKPWLRQVYKENVKGKKFASQIPGRKKYTGLTLGDRAQPYRP